MGSLRVGHDWATSLSLFTLVHWRRKWQSTSVFLPGESQGRQSLVGCRLWGRTELDTTEVTWQQQQQQQIKIHSPVLIAFLLLSSLQQGLNTTEQYMPSLNSSSRHALKLLLTALVSDLVTNHVYRHPVADEVFWEPARGVSLPSSSCREWKIQTCVYSFPVAAQCWSDDPSCKGCDGLRGREEVIPKGDLKLECYILPLANDSVQFSSVTQLCPTLWDLMDCSAAGFPVHHQLPELSQTHVHQVSDAIQPSHPLLSPSQSFPASGSFPKSQFFASDGQRIGVLASTSVLPMKIQDWSPSGWTGWLSFQSKGLSIVLFNTTVQKHQFFGAQLSL